MVFYNAKAYMKDKGKKKRKPYEYIMQYRPFEGKRKKHMDMEKLNAPLAIRRRKLSNGMIKREVAEI